MAYVTDFPSLSSTAQAWLIARGATRRRAPYPPGELERRTAIPNWAPLRAVEATYGGLFGVDPEDMQEIWAGVDETGAFGAEKTIDGRAHRLVGGYGPILWFMDEAGRVVEIDDLGERFYESDTLTHRIEQLARFHFGTHAERLEGGHGERLARALDLRAIEAATDSRQRYWEAADSSLLVRESLEPADYGSRTLVTLTWLMAPSPEVVRRALRGELKSSSSSSGGA